MSPFLDLKEDEIMNREIKRQKLKKEIAEFKVEINERELKIMDLEDEELFEEYAEEFDEEEITVHTEFGAHRKIRGFMLADSLCKEYNTIEYGGDGAILFGGRKCPITVDELLYMVDDPKCPRTGIDQRIKYIGKQFGKKYSAIDRLMYNYFKGKLNDVIFEHNLNKDNPQLKYNQGQLNLGDS